MKNRQNHPDDPRTYVGAGPAALFSDLRHVEALLAGDQRFPRFQRNRAIRYTSTIVSSVYSGDDVRT